MSEVLSKVPVSVLNRLRWAQGVYANCEEMIAQGREMDRLFGGGGRYEEEVRAKLPGENIAAAQTIINTFRDLAPKNEVDAEVVLAAVGITDELISGIFISEKSEKKS